MHPSPQPPQRVYPGWPPGRFILVFFPAPAALGKFFGASLFDNDRPQAVMGLLRGDGVDAGMVVLGVIPGKVATEVIVGLGVIQKLPGILLGAFDGAEGRFDERIVVGGEGASKQLGRP